MTKFVVLRAAKQWQNATLRNPRRAVCLSSYFVAYYWQLRNEIQHAIKTPVLYINETSIFRHIM